jgi:hypothetical protein
MILILIKKSLENERFQSFFAFILRGPIFLVLHDFLNRHTFFRFDFDDVNTCGKIR